jgi:hypothetical protein
MFEEIHFNEPFGYANVKPRFYPGVDKDKEELKYSLCIMMDKAVLVGGIAGASAHRSFSPGFQLSPRRPPPASISVYHLPLCLPP